MITAKLFSAISIGYALLLHTTTHTFNMNWHTQQTSIMLRVILGSNNVTEKVFSFLSAMAFLCEFYIGKKTF